MNVTHSKQRPQRLASTLGILALALTFVACGRFDNRPLQFHDTRAVKTPRNEQEGGRKIHTPSRRASDSRPRAEQNERSPLESERMDVERYRVYVQTQQDERRRRYGPPEKRKKNKPKTTKRARPAPPKP